MRIEADTKLDFSDVLLKPKRSEISSRKDISLVRDFKFKHSDFTWSGIPIISSNMTSVTTKTVAEKMAARNMLACLPRFAEDTMDQNVNFIPSIGIKQFIDPKNIFLCIDVPNAYIEDVLDHTRKMRSTFGPNVILIVGNVVTAEMTEALILAGADIVKVGIGSGSACSTRIKTGVGMPQLSAVAECSDAAHGLGGHIISDGGCTTAGDIAKAFAAGADFVMLGGMLAGHDENGTSFYGMSSERGAEYLSNGLRDYRAAEGWEIELSPRGPIDATLQDIEGGLRSACSYVGAKRLKDLPKCATFVMVNRQANTVYWDNRI